MERMQDRICALARAICRLYPEDGIGANAEDTVNQMRNEGFDYVSIELVRGIHDHLSLEAKKIAKSHENAEKALYYTMTYTQEHSIFKRIQIWSERYVLLYDSNNSDFHHVQIFDCFNDKSAHINVEKSAKNLIQLRALDDYFGLMVERNEHNDNSYFISLVFLDLRKMAFLKLQTVELRGNYPKIIVNKAEPTEFFLNFWIDDGRFIRVCKVDGAKLIIGEAIRVDLSFQSYYNGRLYSLEWIGDENDLIEMSEVIVYNVEQHTTETIQLNLLESYKVNHFDTIEWVRDRVFASLELRNGHRVIIYSDLQTRRWNVIDFAPNFRVSGTALFNESELVICTEQKEPYVGDSRQFNLFFYKLSMRKPDYLRNMAWLTLVKIMKKCEGVADPYEAARRYLPYSSDIRCPFVQPDPNEKKGPPVKRSKKE